MTHDEMKGALCHEIYALVDMYGLDMDDSLTALASAITRIVCQKAPDRQTAEMWQACLMGAIQKATNEAADDGYAVWSKVNFH